MSILSRLTCLFRRPAQVDQRDDTPMSDEERAARIAEILQLPDDEQLARYEELARLFNDEPLPR